MMEKEKVILRTITHKLSEIITLKTIFMLIALLSFNYLMFRKKINHLLILILFLYYNTRFLN